MSISERQSRRSLFQRRRQSPGFAERARRQRAEDGTLQRFGDVNAEEAGKADGEIEIPSNESPVCPAFINRVIGYTDVAVADIGKEWLEEDQLLYARQKALEAQLGAPWSGGAEKASASQDDMRAAAPALPPWTFWVFVAAILVADFPLTLTVFETLSPGPGGITDYLLAIGVQGVLFAAAKAAGILLSKAGFAPRAGGVARTGIAVVAVLVVVASVSLAFFRTEVVSERLSQTTVDEISSLFQPTPEPDEVTSPSPGDPPAGSVVSTPNEPSSVPSLLTFGSLLILTFVVGTILGWLTHSPHAQGLARRLARVRAERRRRFEVAEADAETAQLHARTIASSYWAANIDARREPISPKVHELAEEDLPLAQHPWRQRPDEKYDF